MRKKFGKRLVTLSLALVLGLSFTGCGKSDDSEETTTATEAATTEASKDETVAAEGTDSDDASDSSYAELDAISDKSLKVKILSNKESLCLAPVHIAQINGYFDEEFAKAGVEYEMVVSNFDTITEQISSKDINAGYGLTGSLMLPISNGLDIVFVTGLHTGCTKYYVKPDSDIKTLEDLKGKTIGVPSLSDSSVIQLKRKLADLGFVVTGDKADINLVAYAMTDLPVALDNGAVDAVGLHDPVATTAEESYGFTKILDTGTDEKFVNEYCCQAYVSGELAEKNPAGAAAYARAIQRACAYIEAEPIEAARLQVENGYMPGDYEHNGQILESFDFNPSVAKGRATFENTFDELQKTGDLDESLDKDEFVSKIYPTLPGIPETTTYDKDTGEFTEVY
ncbi:MAG: ABC transporter substrate-binding protein [Lachnospiraceae bacterium]|nr:ABC transporter substrate-binding protein [Lachnospiraceae bacterium]